MASRVETPPMALSGDANGTSARRRLSSGSSRAQPQYVKKGNTRYKTELCRAWQEKGVCKYSDKCQFAHGQHELRAVQRHPKYKTEYCRTFHKTGMCPYGPRCHFIHDESEREAYSPSPSAPELPSLDSLLPEERCTTPETVLPSFGDLSLSADMEETAEGLVSAGASSRSINSSPSSQESYYSPSHMGGSPPSHESLFRTRESALAYRHASAPQPWNMTPSAFATETYTSYWRPADTHKLLLAQQQAQAPTVVDASVAQPQDARDHMPLPTRPGQSTTTPTRAARLRAEATLPASLSPGAQRRLPIFSKLTS